MTPAVFAIEAADFHGVAVTLSIGVAEWRASNGSLQAAIGLADGALFAAKRNGRNRIVVEAGPAASNA